MALGNLWGVQSQSPAVLGSRRGRETLKVMLRDEGTLETSAPLYLRGFFMYRQGVGG